MGRLIDHFGPVVMRDALEPMAALIRAIMYQQVTGKAAASMQRKMLALYSDEGRMPTPDELLGTTDEVFRTSGVSRQKAAYLRDLAIHIADGRLDFSEFHRLSDEEVTSRLVAIKGIGEWTAHMFLMFHLRRPDVLPVGDLGVRHGIQIAYGLESIPTRAEVEKIGAPWAPFRSVGSWYMWRVVEGPAEGW